jgi:hypothetical protein
MENNMLIPNHKWGLRQILSLCSPSNQQVNDRDKTILDKDATQPPQNAKIARLYEQGVSSKRIALYLALWLEGILSPIVHAGNCYGPDVTVNVSGNYSAYHGCKCIYYDDANVQWEVDFYRSWSNFGSVSKLGWCYHRETDDWSASLTSIFVMKQDKNGIATTRTPSNDICTNQTPPDTFDEVKLEPDTRYVFKNPSETDEYFACNTDSNGYFISHYTAGSVENGLKKCSETVYESTCPTVDLSVNKLNVSEAATNNTIIVTATASPAVTGSLSVDLAVSGVDTSDYSLSNTTITIPDSSSTGTVTFTVQDNNLYEGDKTATLTISNLNPNTSTYSLGTTTQNVTITDNESQPNVSLGLSGSPLAENGGVATVTATLSNPSYQNVTVNLSLSGTATGSTDYTASDNSITISAGQTSGSMTLTGIDDSLDEENETIIVDINNVTNGTENGTQQVTATITDDDNPPTVQFTAASQSGAENGGTQTITAQLSAASSKTVSIPFTLGGTATQGAGNDYTITASPITIPAGSTTATITITPINDSDYENDETVIVTIGTPTNATASGVTVHTATITNDDALPTVSFTAANQNVAENTASATITAQLSAASIQTITVPFTINGSSTATGGGTDYSISATPITINAGSTSADITLTVINDSIDEADETVVVNMGTPTNATQGATTSHIATIQDDDTAGITITETGGSTVVNESGTTDTFTVVLDTQPTSNVEIAVSSGDTGEATVSATPPLPLTFTPSNWNTAQTVIVTGVDDFSIDNNQTTTITLSVVDDNSDDKYDPIADKTVSVTTVDNDTPGITVNPTSLTVSENGTATFAITLNTQPSDSHDVTISSITANGECSVSPTTTTIANANWNTDTTFTVTAADDSIIDGTQTCTIQIGTSTSSDGDYNNLDPDDVTITIQDNDTAGITPTSSNITIAEGGATGSYNISLNTQPSGNVEIVVTADAQTQISSDGTTFGSSLTLTFTNSNWNSSQTITVQAVDDAAVESNHTSTITHAITGTVNDTNYPLSLSLGNVTANITDNDQSSTENQNTQVTQPLPTQMSLTIKMTGLGFGKVTSTPSGINCQTADQECQATFKTGTTVKLTTTSDTGSEFSSWGGHSDCYDGQVFLTSSRTCEASFKLGPRTLTIVPAEQGTVSSQPEGISCGLDNQACTFTFDGGSKITLAATPNVGWLFDGWEGEGCENVLTLTQNLSCQPRFSLAPATLEDLQFTQPDGAVITEMTSIHTTVGQPATQTITLTNNGATEMVLSDLTLPPGFQLTSPLPEKIAVGDSVPLQVQLIAETEGVLQGNLSFNVNGQPVSYPLTGTVTTETVTCAEATRLYVNQTAVGNQTGCNWLDAIPQLQMALTAIREGKFPAVKEIWIAKGTYKPTEDLNREASFALIDNLAIYGGFAGVETQLAERNSSENQTILSGDIGLVGDNSDNSFHVVTSTGNQATAMLNGVIITAGNANGEGDYACGGGIFNDASQPTFKHILVSDNTAVTGGGMCNQNASQPLLTESMLENNTASEGGGMVNLNQSAPQLSDVTIIGNTANFAGAMLNQNSSPILMQTTITANSAPNSSGLVNQDGSQVQINNSTIWNNSANTEGLVEPQIIDENAQTVVNDSTVQGGFVGEGNTSELPDGNGIAQVDQGAFETPATYPFTVTLTGTGAGTVTTEGMVCGDECQQEYPGGQQIMLIAQAADGSQFLGWFGDCLDSAVQIEVEMTHAQQCQAQFDLIPTETTPSTDEETSTPVVTPPPTPSTTTTPVEPTVVIPTPNNCPTTGGFQVVCNVEGQVVTDLVVEEGGDLSNGVVETSLVNKGRVANLTITETGSVTGGTVTGLTHNQGMMSDFEFVGYKIEGQNKNGEIKGRLAGRILNRSPLSNAYFKDLRLAQNTRIEGNIILKGHILGEETAPATLNGVIIETGTHIANAVIEKGTTIKPKATLENVTLQGLEVERVTLSGRIQNSGGRFHQVKLGPKAQVSGGTFSGTITGEAKAPALIEETTIEAGTRLSHVRIGNNVVLADEVIFGAGVEFLNPPQCETKALPYIQKPVK